MERRQAAFQFEQNVPWIASPAIHYHLGVDGLSMWLMVLTGFLAPLGVLISWRAIDSRKKLFYVLFLLQQVAMMGIFASLDMFLYYAFWEMSLVPMTLLIATFGRTEKRRRAAIKYFLYAFIPSGLLLVAMLWIYAQTGTFDLPTLATLGGATRHLRQFDRAVDRFAGVPAGLCGEGTDLSAARVAQRCDLRSAHRGRHGAGGQDCALLHIAFLLCDLPCRVASHCPADDCPGGHRHCLRSVCWRWCRTT